ncbi:MAG: hypothetical protein SOY37_01800 [Oscillospiraceae bacterium]|nr:hypothetical protein [Oscillospiraceae bacterium]
MKQCKTILLLTLTAALLLTLSACGGSDSQQPPSPTPGSVESPVPDTTTPPSVETEEPVPETTPEATVVPAEPSATPEPVTVADPKATAESLIGSDVSALYAAIGYPTGSSYASSCLGDGEDGELYYDGFTVYTYRENGVETISVVL